MSNINKKKTENIQNTVDSYIKTSVKIAKDISNNLQNDLSPVLEPIEDYMKLYIDAFRNNILPQNLDKPHQKYKYLICIIHVGSGFLNSATTVVLIFILID